MNGSQCVCRSIYIFSCDNKQHKSSYRSRFYRKKKSVIFFFFVCLFRLFFLLFQHTDTRVCVFCLTENHLYCYNCITVAICFLFGYSSCCCCLKRENKYILGTIKSILCFFYFEKFQE
jgi:hypothetical protein